MSSTIKMAHGRVGFALSVRKGFTELVVHELDCKVWAIIYQVSNVRKAHPWQKEQHSWGLEVLPHGLPRRCFLLEEAQKLDSCALVGIGRSLRADGSWELYPCIPAIFWHFPRQSGCFLADTMSHMLSAGPDEALILNTEYVVDSSRI